MPCRIELVLLLVAVLIGNPSLLVSPFICEFRFAAPELYSTIASNAKSFTTSSSSSKTFIAKYFSEWKTYSDASDYCQTLSESNSVGDTAKGQLASFFWLDERNAISKLLRAVGADVTANGGSSNQLKYGGAWIGARTISNAPFGSTSAAAG